MSKRILITGGAGFIGSHLCRRLLSQGHQVICLDNFSTGSEANVADLFNIPRFTLINQDVATPLNLEIDEIYNLACPASPPHYQTDPIRTIKTNILGTMHMLGLALSQEAKMLQASTSEVYGDPLVHPQREDYWGNVNPIGKRSCYDEGKRCAETLCFEYQRQYGLDIKIVRIFNTYGPNMHPEDGRVISNFIVQALKEEDLTIYGTGDQTRSFCYITDLVDGLVRMMATEKGFIGPVNLGNPDEFTILELAKKVLQLTDARSRLVFRPLPPDDPQRRRPDISLARSKLGWQPSVSLDDGLRATIAYFRRRLGVSANTDLFAFRQIF
ncbi:UDP-glucuronic acid decarboxylase family protein [Sporolituus thermophilus]|uniref:UDP-glucuronate decarboxylase n=1 Tax=Sporolituus thermophilus DSM 23256 TaxID=1123285 RepID=A0A1G7LW56_9FIRM|nr:UDP-glucuronic acid decarboxylase family protein [Sporolituus thermophilus]SDF53747.1 UDP-glucuronate decarboxylase [Sporolituus thermophilus DSM 23256]